MIHTNITTDESVETQNRISEVEIETNHLKHLKTRRGERFLKGPIPFPDISTAARLSGQALAIFLAVHHQIALSRKSTITLPSRLLSELGCSRSAKSRGLRALEESGLITVVRAKGRAARITLNDTKMEKNTCGQF
jgi:hypothetical protein